MLDGLNCDADRDVTPHIGCVFASAEGRAFDDGGGIRANCIALKHGVHLAVSKKSSPCICPLKTAKPVLTLLIPMMTSTEPVLEALSSTTVQVVLLKGLSCVDKPMWLYEKRGKVWPLSMV